MGKLNKETANQEKVFIHFSHDHPLQLTRLFGANQAICSGCRSRILPSKDYFACTCCGFCLHDSCSNLPREIRHPADPDHDLVLAMSASFQCKACGAPGSGFSYGCKDCAQDFHVLCTLKPLSTAHDSHHHLLGLKVKPPYDGKGFRCDICAQPGLNQWLYRCDQCGFDVHLHCANSQSEPTGHTMAQQNLASKAYCRSQSLANDTPESPGNIVFQSGLFSKPASFPRTSKPTPSSSDRMTTITTQGPSEIRQFNPNSACTGQAGNFSNRFQGNIHGFNANTASSANRAIPAGQNGSIINAPQGPTSRPHVAYANQRTNISSGRQNYSSNGGLIYLTGAQGSISQPIYLRPNGGAPTATIQHGQGFSYGIPVNRDTDQGSTSGMTGAMVDPFGGGWNDDSKDSGVENFMGKTLRSLILPSLF